MQQLINQIEQWAGDRNLINGSTPQKQMLKLMEEFGELCGGIARNNPEMIKDEIGYCFVVLTILNKQVGNKSEKVDVFVIGDDEWFIEDAVNHLSEYLGNSCEYPLEVVADLQFVAKRYDLDFKDCVQSAYNQIKDRKGKMIDGVFVKEEGLNGEN